MADSPSSPRPPFFSPVHLTSGPDATEARSTIEVSVDRAAVWRALTTGDGLRWWMGDGATVEPRPGGLVDVPDVVTGITRRGRVGSADPGRRLEFVWWPSTRPWLPSAVTIELDDVEEVDRLDDDRVSTRITVTEIPVLEPIETTAPTPPVAVPEMPVLESIPRKAPGFGVPTRTDGPVASVAPPPWEPAPVLRAGWVWRLALVSMACAVVRY